MNTDLYGFDAYAPSEVARRVESVGVAKARLALLPLVMLGLSAAEPSVPAVASTRRWTLGSYASISG